MFARDDLMYSISRSIDKDLKSYSKSDVFVNGIKYVSFPRGSKIRVIAYILKSEVKNIQKEPELNVVQMNYKEDSLYKGGKDYSVGNIKENKTATKQEEIKPIENKGTNSYKKINNIIDYIIQSKNIKDISDTLMKEKLKGKVMYDAFTKSILYPEKCYLIVFDPFTGAIMAFLDKGTGKSRTNLINNILVEDFLETYNKMTIVWLQIY